MDKRTLLALALMAWCIVVTPMLFPSSRRAPAPAPTATAATRPHQRQPRPSVAPPAPLRWPQPPSSRPPTQPAARPVARDDHARHAARASTRSSIRAPCRRRCKVPVYRDLRPGRAARDSHVVIAPRAGPLLHYRLAHRRRHDRARHAFRSRCTQSRIDGHASRRRRSRSPINDGGRLSHVGARSRVPTRRRARRCSSTCRRELRSIEADTLDDMRHLAYGYKLPRRDVVERSVREARQLVDARRHRLDAVGGGAERSIGSWR